MRKFDETLDVLKQLQQGRSLLTDPRYRPAVDHLHMALVDNIARTEVNVGAYMLALVIADEARSAAETRASGLEAKEVSEIPFQVRLRVASEELVAINRLDAFAQRRARRNPKSVSAAAWNFRRPLLTRPSNRSSFRSHPRISIQTQSLSIFPSSRHKSYVSNWAVSYSIPHNPQRRLTMVTTPSSA
jgi:hypothetical protein